jgi:hypothetical protein
MMNRCHRSGRRGAAIPARFTKSGLIPCHSHLTSKKAASRLFPHHSVPTFFSREVSYGFLSETDLAELGVESVHFRAVRVVEDAQELVGEVPF